MVKGKAVEYEVISEGVKVSRVGIVEGFEFSELVGKPVFTVKTVFGNRARLTKDEIVRFL